jgi:hypothetical protein
MSYMVKPILAILTIALALTLSLTLFVQVNDVQSQQPPNVPPDDGRAHGCASGSAASGRDLPCGFL